MDFQSPDRSPDICWLLMMFGTLLHLPALSPKPPLAMEEIVGFLSLHLCTNPSLLEAINDKNPLQDAKESQSRCWMTHQVEGGRHRTSAKAFRGAPSSHQSWKPPPCTVEMLAAKQLGQVHLQPCFPSPESPNFLCSPHLSELNVKGKYSFPQYRL